MRPRIDYKDSLHKSLKVASAGLGAIMALLAKNAHAGNDYFQLATTTPYGITAGGTYSWDGPNWATTSGGTEGAFVPGSFAEFNSPAANYTVTAAADELNAGMFLTVGSVALTINSTGSGTLDMASGVQGFLGHSSSSITINAPISGVGGVEPENGGTIAFNGANTYTGGTTFASSSTLVDYNNGSAFGNLASDVITLNESATAYAPLLSTGGATITLPNNFVLASTSGANFANGASTPVITTGTWSLGAFNLNLRNNGDATAPLTLSGNISGTGNISISGANGGTINFNGPANNYTGTTTIGLTGDTSITLKLGAANAISSSSGLTLAGGTLNPGGFNQAMTSPLGMTASSTIDFGAGASAVSFANSSATTWTGDLNLNNFNSAVDSLQFGTDATGLTAGQLGDIEFNGAGLGTAQLSPQGYVEQVPEPPAAILGLLGGVALLWRKMRRAA